jgi:hypothetical protein
VYSVLLTSSLPLLYPFPFLILEFIPVNISRNEIILFHSVSLSSERNLVTVKYLEGKQLEEEAKDKPDLAVCLLQFLSHLHLFTPPRWNQYALDVVEDKLVKKSRWPSRSHSAINCVSSSLEFS